MTHEWIFLLPSQKWGIAYLWEGSLNVVYADQLLKDFFVSLLSTPLRSTFEFCVAFKWHFPAAVEWKDVTCTSLLSGRAMCSKWLRVLSFLLDGLILICFLGPDICSKSLLFLKCWCLLKITTIPFPLAVFTPN